MVNRILTQNFWAPKAWPWPDHGSLPVLKPQEVCRLLERIGFGLVRQRGSHAQDRHADGRCTTVPMHKGRDIAPPLLRQIARDICLTVEELVLHR